VKIDSPASIRNCVPIGNVLTRYLPQTGFVLELASGGGFHVGQWAMRFPGLTFQPTDVRQEALESINEWICELELENVRAPIMLDATANPWPVEPATAVVCVNLTHISPWQATMGLIAGAQRTLAENGVLFIYGPFNVGGNYTSEGNRDFDASLRRRNPAWGIRDMEQVVAAAQAHGLVFAEKVEMPANNLSLIFRQLISAEDLPETT
jgi:hypothetical protein